MPEQASGRLAVAHHQQGQIVRLLGPSREFAHGIENQLLQCFDRCCLLPGKNPAQALHFKRFVVGVLRLRHAVAEEHQRIFRLKLEPLTLPWRSNSGDGCPALMYSSMPSWPTMPMNMVA